MSGINLHGIWAIYRTEMARAIRTVWQSIATPVITTALYFVVFGGAIGSRMSHVGGVGYGAFIVPGLIMLSLLTQSISNASIGIYFPKFTGTMFEILSAPLSAVEAVIGYVGAAATKSVVIGLIILATATFFTDVRILHPVWMVAFLLLTSLTFSLFGFLIGIWAKSFRAAGHYPLAGHHAAHLPWRRVLLHRHVAPAWRTVSLFNPVVYLVSGFRWSFYGLGDVGVGASLGFTAGFMALCLIALTWIFRTGWRLKP
jgi:ABC-2 type transport system permease protein